MQRKFLVMVDVELALGTLVQGALTEAVVHSMVTVDPVPLIAALGASLDTVHAVHLLLHPLL